MLPADRKTRSRLALAAAIGGTAVLATALIVITSNPAPGTGGVALQPAAAVTDAAQLDGIDLPAPPTTCSAAQLAERDRQVQLLHDEQANEQRVLDTITDGSREDKLGAIRDRAEIIVGRIEQIDGRCPVVRPGAPSSDPQAPPTSVVPAPSTSVPAGADRTLTALAISCDDPDLTGVDQAAADRARTELDSNRTQLNDRLTREFPRFSARVAREADPTAAANEFANLADDLSTTLEARRTAILQRAGVADAAAAAATCEVVPAAAAS